MLSPEALEGGLSNAHPSYHGIPQLYRYAQKNQCPETPNMVAIYLLGKVAEDLNRRGKKALWSETKYKAALIYQCIENHPEMNFAIQEKRHRSLTTLVAKSTKSEAIRTFMKEKGFILGSGYGQQKEKAFRIANFPTHSKEQVELLCDRLAKFG
jgi:phosphoserine aminotransferase